MTGEDMTRDDMTVPSDVPGERVLVKSILANWPIGKDLGLMALLRNARGLNPRGVIGVLPPSGPEIGTRGTTFPAGSPAPAQPQPLPQPQPQLRSTPPAKVHFQPFLPIFQIPPLRRCDIAQA